MKMRKDVTIAQVAEAAGVSRASVSRAFTRPEMLNPQTVLRVRDAAAALGYQPNHSARALSTGRNFNIALVVPDVGNPFFPPMIRAAQRSATSADFCLFLGDSNETPALEARLITRFSSQIDGLVIASSRLLEAELLAISALRPVVLINREVAGLPAILIDSAQGMAQAFAHLHALGHARVAYVNGPESSWSNFVRRRAAEAASKRLGMVLEQISAVPACYETGRASADAVLALGVTAVVVFDDITAHGLMTELLARGLSIPDQMSLIGCDDVLGAITAPALSSISSPTEEAGAMATELLIEMIEGKSKGEVYRLSTSFVARATTARASGS